MVAQRRGGVSPRHRICALPCFGRCRRHPQALQPHIRRGMPRSGTHSRLLAGLGPGQAKCTQPQVPERAFRPQTKTKKSPGGWPLIKRTVQRSTKTWRRYKISSTPALDAFRAARALHAGMPLTFNKRATAPALRGPGINSRRPNTTASLNCELRDQKCRLNIKYHSAGGAGCPSTVFCPNGVRSKVFR